MNLYRKYQPKTWEEYIGQDNARDKARRLITRAGFTGGVFWIDCAGTNNSGVGKSTLAWLMARELADEFFITPVDGDKVDKLAVREIERTAGIGTWGEKRFRVWIIDEAHAMTPGAVDAMLPLLERLPANTVIIFTTTREVDQGLFGEDAGPFASRCIRIRLTNQGLAKAFAERARTIAQAEGLDGQPIERYVKLAQDAKNNMRAILQRIEGGEMLV